MEKQNKQPEVLYADISGEQEPTVMESMCVQCESQKGQTTIMLSKIPFFKEIIVISFYCDECGYKNSECQFGGKLADYGLDIHFKVTHMDDFKRDIVKSEHCVIQIPELQFEIPTNKKASINTLEGFFANIVEDLESDQPARKHLQPEVYEKMEEFINKLKSYMEGQHFPFTFHLYDPSGNSFVKNIHAPKEDPNLKIKKFVRTIEQLTAMGYSPENAQQEYDQMKKDLDEEEKSDGILKPIVEESQQRFSAHMRDFTKPFNEKESIKEESLIFKVPCHNCGREGENKMCTTSIPYFKEILVMAFVCEFCGVKSTETKVGGAMTEKGIEIKLSCECEDDLKRDMFKSDTASVYIPEVDLGLEIGTLGGVYTTVEGLLEQILSNFKENNPFVGGDSSEDGYSKKLEEMFDKLEEFKAGKKPFHLEITDLQENSFLQNPYHPKEDPRVQSRLFVRTPEQDDELGIKDMKTENYC